MKLVVDNSPAGQLVEAINAATHEALSAGLSEDEVAAILKVAAEVAADRDGDS